MSTALVLNAVLTYGPEIIPLITQLAAWIKGGKTEVTADDLAFLVKLSNKTAADYLAEAGVKVPS